MSGAASSIRKDSSGIHGESDPAVTQPSRWLRLARLGWVIFLGLALLVFLIAIPGYALGLENFTFTATSAAEPSTVDKILNFLGMTASLLAVLVSLGLAALLFWRRQKDWMALYLSYFLIAYGIVLAGPLEVAGASTPGLSGLALRYGQPILVASPLIILFCIFPSGKFQPAWSMWLAITSVVLIPLLISTPFYSGPSDSAALVWLSVVMWIVLVIAALFSQIHRYRHISSFQERQQTKWAVFGFILWVVSAFILTIPYLRLLGLPAGADVPAWAAPFALFWWVSLLIIPVTLTIAVMGYRLWDLGLVINRTLVYGGLTTSIVIIYILSVGALGTLFQAQGNFLVALIATGLVAVLFQPIREWLQRAVNRLIYGERDDPVTVLTRLGQQLELAVPQEAILPLLVETIAEALKLPYVGIVLEANGEQAIVAEYGRSKVDQIELPLVFQGEQIGKLLVAQRSPNEPFNPAEMSVLGNVARQAGVTAHSIQLTADLQRSRQRLVTTREEERRRLRRDLHDGLGPALAAHLLKIGSARSILEEEPTEAARILDELEGDMGLTLAEIRHLVYGLRPPELDQLGLLAAIEQYVDRYSMAIGQEIGENGLKISIDSPGVLPSLPAAVEVAAYRIVQEGINNVALHAQASHCQLGIVLAGNSLDLDIVDDGIGIATGQPSGVGLASMRERAEELGGTCQVRSQPGLGTQVSASLPLVVLADGGNKP